VSKIRRLRIKFQRHEGAPGRSPGAYVIKETALKPRITIHSYGLESYVVHDCPDHLALEKYLNEAPDLMHWIDIKGLGDQELLAWFQQKFQIHKLVMEDVVHTHQRPKLDEYDDYIFVVSRSFCVNTEELVENDQVAFICTEKIVISFQDTYRDCLDPVRQRLSAKNGRRRFMDSSYLLYSLMDVILDNYFSVLHRLGDELDTLEELAFRRAGKEIIYHSQQIKKILIALRRAAWPERDKLNDLMRSTSSLITPETKTFLKDAYDHCMQVIDLVESYKDITTSVIDMNLSFQSNRMNEIMKLLTIISSIFIPLTFIAGVYGMNFAYRDPESGQLLEQNMPELYAPNGYPYTLAVMLMIALLQLVWFWKKGWLRK
jgi:magnesium transporter